MGDTEALCFIGEWSRFNAEVMHMRVLIEQLELHQDERGSVFEALDPLHISRQENVHVVVTQPGCIRGNHYHTRGTEVIVVCGPALVRLRDGQAIEDISVAQDQALRLTIPPGVSHAIRNTGDRPNVMIAFNSVAYSQEQPDVFRDVLLEREV
jgi:UDP-2-acetamido-2,6-beta-L-arabino-hexul-4-ose reductase